jgi:penicillin-insensitive murein endopeptidase
MLRKLLAILAVIVLTLFTIAAIWAGWRSAEWGTSICYGTPRDGALSGARRLPVGGANFITYSGILRAIGRTSMHGAVRDTILDAYAELAQTSPELRYVYGEASWPGGGPLYPHKTHRNGLSVDFFVPLRNWWGQVRILPTSVFNAFGYGVHFDDEGKGHGLQIDFEALAKHLDALQRAGAKRGVSIRLVILETELQEKLFETRTGKGLSGRIPFSKTRAWVPHDSHYHIDFSVPCQAP